MAKKLITAKKGMARLYLRICDILESAQDSVVRSVNTAQVMANWLIGQEIIEESNVGRSERHMARKYLPNYQRK